MEVIVSKNYDLCPEHFGRGKCGFLWEQREETCIPGFISTGDAPGSVP